MAAMGTHRKQDHDELAAGERCQLGRELRWVRPVGGDDVKSERISPGTSMLRSAPVTGSFLQEDRRDICTKHCPPFVGR